VPAVVRDDRKRRSNRQSERDLILTSDISRLMNPKERPAIISADVDGSDDLLTNGGVTQLSIWTLTPVAKTLCVSAPTARNFLSDIRKQ